MKFHVIFTEHNTIPWPPLKIVKNHGFYTIKDGDDGEILGDYLEIEGDIEAFTKWVGINQHVWIGEEDCDVETPIFKKYLKVF